MDFSKVHSVAIYPSIGIARVGNSPTDFFIGPAIPGQAASDPDDFRDAEGRIKRQAAQFFIYALDENGAILGELNEDHGVKIDWRVDVANKKAAWYNFDIALDTPTAQGLYDMEGNATPHGLPVLSQKRNLEFQGEERKLLMIEAVARRITGRNTNPDGSKYHLNGKIGKGENRKEVYLGELRTDEAGRLLFLGGRGLSDSFNGSPLTTFANNQGWHDDTSDGPVDATVELPDGRILNAEGAWVVTAPPNFAVGVQAFSTGYELILDVAARLHPHLKKETPSFYADIYPTFRQLSINQWVNAGVSREFGWGSAYDFDHDRLLERLTDKSEENRPFRQVIFESFRNPAYDRTEPQAWPPLYGDAVTFNLKSTNPRNWFAITELKYGYLEKWVKGDFILDEPPTPKSWEDLTPAQQAHGLTEAALEETLGGPFHPGCEFTWPMRHSQLYHPDKPFRIRRREPAKEDFGVAISYDIIKMPDGPLDGCAPGDITKWMATPWQSDTSSCLSAYRTYAGEYLPTFWPARVPNDVLSEKDFEIIASADVSKEERIKAFSPDRRKKWLRGYIFNEDGSIKKGSSIADRMKGVKKFTDEWYKIGIILKKEVPGHTPLFPKEVWVETGRSVQLDPEDMPKQMFQAMSRKGEELHEALDRPEWIDMNPRYLR
jgi:hypothetical protein